MASTTETVFVEFVVEGDDLESTTDVLQRTGQIDKQAADQFKKTNAELAKRQKTIDALNKQLRDTQSQHKKTLDDLGVKLEKFLQEFVEGMQLGVVDALKEAGFEFDEFGNIINNTTETASKSTDQLKTRLTEITKQLRVMKAAGEDNTQQYRDLIAEAGNLKDTLGDVSAEINLAAANSQKLNGMIEVAQGVAGVFSVAQGAVGLFGAESEALNEVLLDVNSSMAVLQGLQTVGNVLQKESAAMTLLNATAQKIYTVAVGESVGALKAFRIALLATGIGVAIGVITLLYQWVTRTSKATKEMTREFQRFNQQTALDTENMNQILASTTRELEKNQASGKARGDQQSELAKQEIADLRSTFEAVFQLEQAQRDRARTAEQTLAQIARGERKFNEDLVEELQKTIDNYNAVRDRRADISNQIRIKEIENEKQITIERLQAAADGLNARLVLATKNSKQELNLAKATARAQAAVQLEEAGNNLEKRLSIEADLQARIRELDREFERVRQEDRIAAVDRALIAAQTRSRQINARTSQEEIDLEKQKIQEESRLALMAEGLTENQKLLIKEKSLADQLALQKEFNKQSTADALSDYISRQNAELASIKLTNKERLVIQEEVLIAQAQLEIEANEGLADKIKEIRAKLNADLRALRLAALQQQLQDELSLEQSRTGALRRASERIAAGEQFGLNKRIAALNQLAALDIANVNSRQDALERSLEKGLISQEEYNVQYAALKDEELAIAEGVEIKKRELERDTIKARVLLALESAAAILGIVQQFGQQETEAEQQRIDAQRKEIDDLREAGAITEKEAIARQKKLDQEERAIKIKQANRDKAIALFSAIINTAAAVVKALPNLVLAGIAAALGAAQIALIASKPIPKFAKGKKDHYEGPGEIGEAGAELMEHDGRMYLAKKRTFVWVGKHDKIYNPKETAAMLDVNKMQPYIIKDQSTNEYKNIGGGTNIDYDKLGKVISANIPQIGLDINEKGIATWVAYNNAIVKYLDNRRSYK